MAVFAQDLFNDTAGTVITSHTADVGGPHVKATGATNTAVPVITTGGDAVRCNETSTQAVYYLSGTPASADYTVRARFNYITTALGALMGVCARYSTSANTKYRLYWGDSNFGNALVLDKSISGTDTTLSSLTVAPAAGVVYDLYIIVSGTSISTRIQRLSDNQWLNSSGSWQSSQTNLHTATDSSITAAGKAAWVLQTSGANDRIEVQEIVADDGGGDTTAPVLTSAVGTATGATTATVGATTDEGNGTMYVSVTTSATQPSIAQIKAGQDHTGATAAFASSQAISSTGAKTFSATGLTVSTTYWAHLVHTDAAGNDSNRISSASFTTSAAGATLTSSVLKNNTGTVLASETGATVYVNLASTNALVLTLTSQTTNGSGVWTATNGALTSSTSYRVVYKLASGAEGMETLTAT